jgi:hypothetical protein
MPALRTSSLFFFTSLAAFALCASFVGGCSLFGGDETSGGTPPSTTGSGGDGGAGTGGANTGGAMVSSSSSSGMPVECNDHKENVDETNCSLIKQDCKNPAEKCVPIGTVTTCEYEDGIKGFGAPCSGTDSEECAAGLTCVFFTCSPYCCPSEAQAFCGSAKCNVEINVGGGGVVFACNLSKTCTLFGNDCPVNQQCRLGDPDQELALCAPSSDNPSSEGGPCSFLNDCGANQVCIGSACRYSCLLAGWQNKAPGEGGCPPMQTCTPASPTSTMYGNCGP